MKYLLISQVEKKYVLYNIFTIYFDYKYFIAHYLTKENMLRIHFEKKSWYK